MAINQFAGYNPYPNFNSFGPSPITAVPQPPTQTLSSSFVWVQGEAGAKSYPVAPGNRIALFDSENPVVYIKATDQNGKPLDMEIYDLVRRDPTPSQEPAIDLSEFIKRDELSSMIAAATQEAVDKAMSEISLKPTSTKKKKGDDE